ncbi:hypothetical protein AGR7B_Cc210039 [Agrobacterium deltaense RV3]|nr:hypothetical protein AGR7B_Cc210039 [Agrobacterium deltaense RV3]
MLERILLTSTDAVDADQYIDINMIYFKSDTFDSTGLRVLYLY